MRHMTLQQYIIMLKVSLMHLFTDKYIEELNARDAGTVLEESYNAFTERYIEAFTTLKNLDADGAKEIKEAIEDVKYEATLHVILQGTVAPEGMGRGIDHIKIMHEYWQEHVIAS